MNERKLREEERSRVFAVKATVLEFSTGEMATESGWEWEMPRGHEDSSSSFSNTIPHLTQV